MNNKEKLDAIQKYLKDTRKELNECRNKDWEYTTTEGNGVNCAEASLMFDEVEAEIGKILKSK